MKREIFLIHFIRENLEEKMQSGFLRGLCFYLLWTQLNHDTHKELMSLQTSYSLITAQTLYLKRDPHFMNKEMTSKLLAHKQQIFAFR